MKERVRVQAVCQQFDCTEGQVRMKGRKKNKARETAIYLASDLTGLTCKELGVYFDGVSGALISIMCNRIAGERARNKKLKARIEKIKREILNI
jgi:chromosomal replication initiation ATPase DnaA